MTSNSARDNSIGNRRDAQSRNLVPISSEQTAEEHHGLGPDFPTVAQMAANLPGFTSYWDPSNSITPEDTTIAASPLGSSAIQAALPPALRHRPLESPQADFMIDPYDHNSIYGEDAPPSDYGESDRIPLTSEAQPLARSLAAGSHTPQPRDSFQTISDLGNSPSRIGKSGQDIERALGSDLRQHHASVLSGGGLRSSHSSSSNGALLRAGSIVRAMSQRVVNLSGESEMLDRRASRPRSPSPRRQSHQDPTRTSATPVFLDTSYPSQIPHSTEKGSTESYIVPERVPYELPPRRMANPFKGYSLGVFSPDSYIRLWLCDLLVKPYTEPIILLFIVAQTVLLTVESAPSVFSEGNGRPEDWGQRATDWAMLGLFITFTLELIARIIVSGFIVNAAEYSTIDRNKGVRAAITSQYRNIFQPQRQKSLRGSRHEPSNPPVFARSFTTFIHGQQQELPQTLEDQQRFQLARRAFLRHSFNRLDFLAVLSFWVDFTLSTTGIEDRHKLYIFKMLSCLRILRLLALTHGTAIILRSLKKATPLLVRVAFLVGFFWVLFAIIGVQSFKASLRRQCVWLDPQDPTNLAVSFTNELTFCGGYRHNQTGEPLPWVRLPNTGSLDRIVNGTREGKGFLCPRGSICLEQDNPFGGTVSFDNIFQSLELIFVVMSANTFSNLMYYTMGTDYAHASLFFVAAIVILTLWLTNLLIAVITSSFQVIREESKSSAFTTEEQQSAPARRASQLQRKSSLKRIYNKTVWLWVVTIAFGLASQAFRSSSMTASDERFVNIAEIAVTGLLDFEIAIRLTVDWRRFHQSRKNLFDLALALSTTVILLPPIRQSSTYPWLTIFQILRTYRIVLAIPVTRTLIFLVLGNAAGIANLMLFVFLMTFLMAIFAAQLFRGTIPLYDDGELNRVSFHTIYNSFIGMYQVLTSENWTDILYSVTSYSSSLAHAWIGAMFLVAWFILSFFILINMFIAVIQENFDVSEDEKRLEQVKSFLQRKQLGQTSSTLALSTIVSLGRSRRRKDPLDYGPAMMEMLLKDAVVREFLNESANHPVREGGSPPHLHSRTTTTLLGGDAKPGVLSKAWANVVHWLGHDEPNPFYTSLRFEGPNGTLDPRQMARQAVSATSARRKAQREYLARHRTYNSSLYYFGPKHRVRRLCQRLVGPARGIERIDGVEPNKTAWYSFSAFIYAAIVAMVAIACVATPLYQKEYQEQHAFSIANWYVWTDMAFAVVFTFEAAVKVIADGIIWTPNAYLRSPWGIMDTVVLVTLWINVVTLLISSGSISRAVGAFKALRALRLLNVSDSARDTFHSLIIVGWWKILGAAFVSISLLIPFAVYGLNIFNGVMIACNDDSGITSLDSCFGEYGNIPFSDEWPLMAPRVASNPYFGFDDFGSSLFTLFQIVSQEGWSDVVFTAQAVTGRGLQPIYLSAEGNALFFIAFNILATVFVLTLFISVFMRNYTEQTGVAFLTAEQRSWLELRKRLRQISPSKSSYSEKERTWKRWCHKRAIEKRGPWYQAYTLILVLHLVLLVVEYEGEPDAWTRARELIFLAFILFYAFNILIRILGLGWTRFRRSSWNLYSLLAVSGALISTVALLLAGDGPHQETIMRFHKTFLVTIVLLIIPRNDALDQLFKTAAASLTVIGNLLATWLVMFIVFAIAMTQAFSLTRFGDGESTDINFRTVPNALVLLFRMSLGEGWNQVMEDYAEIEPPLCVDVQNFFESDCGSKVWARFLFVSWNLLSMYIFVNLFVSLIYESFSYVYQRSNGMANVDRDEIRRFKEAWRSVDPTGKGCISKETFPRLLGELSGVFQMRIYDAEDSIRSILDEVREDSKTSRHVSLITSNADYAVDTEKLNRRLARLDIGKIRDRRRRFNLFYGEVMVSADPDTGISFTNVLMILAHYNIISDSKSLKLEEFLRRRARLQRVEDEVRRKVVQGFFDTLYYSRKFKQHLERIRSSRMTTIPYLGVPDIFIEDKDRVESLATPAQVNPHGMANSASDAAPRDDNGVESAWRSSGTPDMAYQHPLSLPHLSQPPIEIVDPSSGFTFELCDSEVEDEAAAELERTGSFSQVQETGILHPLNASNERSAGWRS